MEIIFESESVVVINKPAGIAVHDDGKGRGEHTIADWFVEYYPNARDVGEPIVLSDGTEVPRHGIVHRLDKGTSGCLILAKTQESYIHLKRQFKNHEVQKEYRAFVYGTLKLERGTINAPIGRAAGTVEKRATGRDIRGDAREAQTIYRVIQTGTTDGTRFSFVAFFPKTGRTHQIRVHALHLRHPIISDFLYAPRQKKLLGFMRPALHAYRIVFHDLAAGEVTAIAPYPADFDHALTMAKGT